MPLDTSTALGVARIVGRSEVEVDAYKDVEVQTIARDLALGLRSAVLIGELGTPIIPPGAPVNVFGTVEGVTQVDLTWVVKVIETAERSS